MPYRDPVAHREKERARCAAYLAAHREKLRAAANAYRAAHPRVGLMGERTRIDTLPIELQPVALAIREARRLICERTNPK